MKDHWLENSFTEKDKIFATLATKDHALFSLNGTAKSSSFMSFLYTNIIEDTALKNYHV